MTTKMSPRRPVKLDIYGLPVQLPHYIISCQEMEMWWEGFILYTMKWGSWRERATPLQSIMLPASWLRIFLEYKILPLLKQKGTISLKWKYSSCTTTTEKLLSKIHPKTKQDRKKLTNPAKEWRKKAISYLMWWMTNKPILEKNISFMTRGTNFKWEFQQKLIRTHPKKKKQCRKRRT